MDQNNRPRERLNWINLGMFHDIHRQCLKYPEDAALLEQGTGTGCGGLPDGETGEQCWSGQGSKNRKVDRRGASHRIWSVDPWVSLL